MKISWNIVKGNRYANTNIYKAFLFIEIAKSGPAPFSVLTGCLRSPSLLRRVAN